MFRVLSSLKTELLWFIHNVIAHPISELTHWLNYIFPGVVNFGNWLHDVTVPPHKKGTGRG